MAIVERQNLWTLHRKQPWHPTIEWYGRAVRELKGVTDTADPRSWINMANIHGTYTPREQWPPGIGPDTWNACMHNCWFFLPWHRMYVHHVEKIIRDTVKGLGGPDDWAMPFWNYDPKDPETLALPPEFLQPKDPEGKPNGLYTSARSELIRNGGRIPPESVATDVPGPGGRVPWTRLYASSSTVVPTFGGQMIRSHQGGAMGQIDRMPHGQVHVKVGQPDGLMYFFETAGQDPVFWMHHSNIDRLWEVWRNARNDDPLPKTQDWLGVTFTIGNGNRATTLKVGDVLRTTDAPLEYRFQGVPVPGTPVAAPSFAEAEAAEPTADAEVPPELVGSADGIAVGGGAGEVTIATAQPQAPSLAQADGGGEAPIYLALENVTATDPGSHEYTVHVALPSGADSGEHPDREVGRFSTFGIVEASRRDDEHAGTGLTYSFDITPFAAELQAAGEWNPDELTVTVTPDTGNDGDLRIGRIGVYRG